MTTRWAVEWSSRSKLDGKRKYFMWDNGIPLLFRTRREARAKIKMTWGYIARRPDLRALAVKVEVILRPVKS